MSKPKKTFIDYVLNVLEGIGWLGIVFFALYLVNLSINLVKLTNLS